MNILIYEYRAGGHYLEFISHIVKFLIHNNDQNLKYYLVVPFNFKDFFNDSYREIKNLTNINLIETKFDISNEYLTSKYINKVRLEFKAIVSLVKNYHINLIYLLTVESLSLPLMFYKFKNVKISGILLHPFVRLPKEKILEITKYKLRRVQFYLINRNKTIKNIFILNDSYAANLMNAIFKSHKFGYIPDPILSNTKSNTTVSESVIEKNRYDLILLHIGSLDFRKGTLEAIGSLNYVKIQKNKRSLLIVAGTCNEDFNALINQKITLNNSHFEIKYIRGFLSYEMFDYLFSICDLVIASYNKFPFSSGILNHAISHRKPILVCNYGLMADIVKNNKFGIVIDNCTEKHIAHALNEFLRTEIESHNENYYQYLIGHSAEKFAATLLG